MPKMPVAIKFPSALVDEIDQLTMRLHTLLAVVPRHVDEEVARRGVPKSADGLIDLQARLTIDAARDTLQAALRNYAAARKSHEMLTAGQDTTHA